MKLTSALIYLILQINALSGVHGCDGHDHHHHHHAESIADDQNLTEHQRRLKTLDELPCASPPATKEEKRNAGRAFQNWRRNRGQGNGNGGGNGGGKGNGWGNGKKRELFETQYRIPVTFHVLRKSNGSGNVSNSQLNQYLQYLNDAFEGSPFTFYKKATTRTNNDAWHNCDFNTVTQSGQAGDTLRRGGIADLNVYLCTLNNIGGFAYFPYGNTPGQRWDGVVMESDYTKYGFPSGYVRRTILPHEAAHWLGVHHTFEDGCDAAYDTISGWPAEYRQFNGDGVADTPAMLQSSQDCSRNLNTCPDNNPNIDAGPDPTDNFMSYAYDNCRNRFTDGQFERMLAMFELYRYDPNVVVSGPPPVAPPPTPSPVAEPTRSPVAAPTRTVEPKCFNTARKRDSGCDTGRNKVCVKADDTEPASGEPGTKCVRCVNSHTGNKRDSGCGGIRPLCAYSTTPGDVPPLGKPGTRCVSIL